MSISKRGYLEWSISHSHDHAIKSKADYFSPPNAFASSAYKTPSSVNKTSSFPVLFIHHPQPRYSSGCYAHYNTKGRNLPHCDILIIAESQMEAECTMATIKESHLKNNHSVNDNALCGSLLKAIPGFSFIREEIEK